MPAVNMGASVDGEIEGGVADLSANGTANSYIVSKSGTYKFSTVKGNSSESVGVVEDAEVLWETFGTDQQPSVGDLVKDVSYKDGEITFTATDKKGNAVIAANDADGNILWSWHIWLTDQPEGQVYYNNAGTMMDRNLGATFATPGDVGALGLLYQWGRKDPLLGSSSSVAASSTITWPSAVQSDALTGTIEYSIVNPTTFIYRNEVNCDWYYTGSTETDNTRWTESYTDKSIYDPCPFGWRVPDGGENGVWSKALGSSSDFSHTFSENRGMDFSGVLGADSSIWYPASGVLNETNGVFAIAGDWGSYWSATHPDSASSPNAYTFSFYLAPKVMLQRSGSRAYGMPVRCVQE